MRDPETSVALAEQLKGITPVIMTPFAEDESVDEQALRAQVDWLVSLGVRSVAIGLASEVSRLTDDERIELVALVRLALPRGLTLVAACSADSERAAAAQGRRMAAAGADVLMATPPRVPGIGSDAVASFYSTLARESGAALIVQDAPQETGVGIDDAALEALIASNPSVVAVKLESADALDRMSRLAGTLANAGVLMLGGSGGADYLTELELGVGGTLPGPALADIFIAVDRAYRSGRSDDARATMARFSAQIDFARRGMQPFIRAQRAFMAARGLPGLLESRRPSAPLPQWMLTMIERMAADLRDRSDDLPLTTKG